MLYKELMETQLGVPVLLGTKTPRERFAGAQRTYTLEALMPDGRNWKATMMIEYPDPVVRADKLTKLVGIENKVWAKIENYASVFAIADEDLDRATEEKTSAVHFLRFELNQDMIRALHKGASLSMGIDHPVYLEQIKQVDKLVSNSLIDDLDR